MAEEGKRRWRGFVSAVAAMALLMGVVFIGSASAVTGTIGQAAGFEDNDGNLAQQEAGLIDWNSFGPVTWAPHPATTPTRQASTVLSGFQFLGLEDWQATTSDSSFAGGTKQDDNCASVITAKPDNKADLKRIYLASKTGADGHTYLELAWVRIPQNTTSPSAHVAFEFNQGNVTPDPLCPAGSGGLVRRSTTNGGDLLVVYDFEGGATDNPHITIRRWVGSGSCEISSDSPPCWGVAKDLTDLGFAEAKVNTGGSVSDGIAPPALTSTTGTSTTATLGTNEFGEAGIDLTGAGVFAAGTCSSFGQAHGVSRTSGNSGTAQMKDLVGPGAFSLTNCGEVKVIKRTDPRGLNQDFSYTSTGLGTSTCTGDTTPASFTLNDNGNATTDSAANTEDCKNVPAGSSTVTEGDNPTGFTFESLDCTASGIGTSFTTSGKVASITMAGGGLVTCVYVNQQQLGAIKITKTSSKGLHPTLDGAVFSITQNGSPITGSPFTTANGGVICVDNLAFGDYVVTETTPPTGYAIDDPTGQTVTVDNNAKCSDATFVGETVSATDTPLTDVVITATGEASPAGTTNSQITCTDAASVGIGDSPSANTDRASVTANGLEPGTYTGVVVIDP